MTSPSKLECIAPFCQPPSNGSNRRLIEAIRQMKVRCAVISKQALAWRQLLGCVRFYNSSVERTNRHSIGLDWRLAQSASSLTPDRSSLNPGKRTGIPESFIMSSQRSPLSFELPKEGRLQGRDASSSGGANQDIIDLTLDDASSTVSAESERFEMDQSDNSTAPDANAIIISDEEEENDVSPPPLSAARRSATVATSITTEERKPMPPNNDESHSSQSQAFGLLGIDRKKQEEERLQRLAKRKLADGQDFIPVTKVSKTAPSSSFSSFSSSAPSSRLNSVHPESAKEINRAISDASIVSGSRPSLQYPHGIVKKTWAYGQQRVGDDVKMEEVIQRGAPGLKPIDLAIVSSFQWDTEWLLPKFDIGKTRFLLIMGAKTEAEVGYSSLSPCLREIN